MGTDTRRTSRSRLAALALASAVLLLPAAAPAPAAAACKNGDAHPSDVSVGKIKSATLCLLNGERTSRGRKKLHGNRRLAAAARAHALDMVRKDYFAHTTPSGIDFVDRIRRQDYLDSANGWTVGENLAWGSQQLATPRSIVRAWMSSPGHRANILKPGFREIGIGVVPGAPEPGVERAATYATEFGTRL